METRRLALDMDVVVDFLRRGDNTVPLALQNFECALTAIVVYELHAVAASTRQKTALDLLLQRLSIHPLDSPASLQAAEIRRTLSTVGQVIGVLDVLSAAICLQHDLPLLTRNVDHFRRVPGLNVVTTDELAAIANDR